MAISDLNELGELVDTETIVTTTLGELRKAIGYDRLGKYVLAHISAKLEGEGLGFFPVDLLDASRNETPRQGQELRVYRRGQGVGKLIYAVTHPSDGGDRELKAFSGGEDTEILDQIRALVCP